MGHVAGLGPAVSTTSSSSASHSNGAASAILSSNSAANPFLSGTQPHREDTLRTVLAQLAGAQYAESRQSVCGKGLHESESPNKHQRKHG